MDQGLTVLIVQQKILQMSQNLSGPKVLDFNEKRLYWVSVVHGIVDLFDIMTPSMT